MRRSGAVFFYRSVLLMHETNRLSPIMSAVTIHARVRRGLVAPVFVCRTRVLTFKCLHLDTWCAHASSEYLGQDALSRSRGQDQGHTSVTKCG